jgi:hypothetical protein
VLKNGRMRAIEPFAAIATHPRKNVRSASYTAGLITPAECGGRPLPPDYTRNSGQPGSAHE